MQQERADYIQAIRDLDGDVSGRQSALKFVEDSDIWVHGQPAPFPYVPYLFNDQDMDYLQNVCTMAHDILSKVIAHYLEDPSYQELFHFPPEVHRLITLPCGYREMLPMGRFDIFLDEADGSFKFCEFNTDGAGAASRDLMLGRALMGTPSFDRFARIQEQRGMRVRQFELFDSWVDAFLEVYAQDPLSERFPVPTMCVTDFSESGVFSDFNRFIQAFNRRGVPARFVDVRAFEFDGERLIDPSDGTQIHAIYRRSVTSEIIQHPGECDALINAVAAGKVCLIGHFSTTVVHSKMVNVALFDSRTREFLTDEECAFVDAHVPRTYRLRADVLGEAPSATGSGECAAAGGAGADAGAAADAVAGSVTLADILSNKDAWIVKPEDDYGAHGVHPGVDCTEEQWREVVLGSMDQGFIVQEFYPPRRVDIVLPQVTAEEIAAGKAEVKVESWQSMPGFYQYNGKIAGFYCRLGQEGVIAIDHGGLCANSFKVEAAE